MKLDVADMENGITKISLSGRLDVEGALKIDDEFTEITKGKKNVLVDLSEVPFIASLGIRTLVIGAKATSNNGGYFAKLKNSSRGAAHQLLVCKPFSPIRIAVPLVASR
jgi:anti-anti-sigma factor